MALVIQLESWKVSGLKDVLAEPACTSLPQQWGRPRGTKNMPEPVCNMVIQCPGTSQRKRRPIMPQFNDNRNIKLNEADIVKLKALKGSPICYLVDTKCREDTVDTPFGIQLVGSPLSYHIPLIQTLSQPIEEDGNCGDIAFSKQVDSIDSQFLDKDRNQWNHLNLTSTDSVELEKLTRGQSNSALWLNERKQRITASNFGAVMKRKKEYNDSFMKNTFDKTNFSSASTSYGKSNECLAKQMYVKTTRNHIHDVGLIVNLSFPFIGATPDAIVCDSGVSGLVEIKCPYSVRDSTIADACSERSDFFLKKTGDKFSLSRDHQHWFQVQGQLLVTGAPYCDFVTFTRQDLYKERILPDQNTMVTMLQKLSHLYVNNFKPYFFR